jgi:mycothiol system anti-sigma-R factor
MAGYQIDPCEKCEEAMQPYLDHQLSESELREAEEHLASCPSCAKRYRFEESLRRFVRKCCEEEMTPELKQKLAALRTPL